MSHTSKWKRYYRDKRISLGDTPAVAEAAAALASHDVTHPNTVSAPGIFEAEPPAPEPT